MAIRVVETTGKRRAGRRGITDAAAVVMTMTGAVGRRLGLRVAAVVAFCILATVRRMLVPGRPRPWIIRYAGSNLVDDDEAVTSSTPFGGNVVSDVSDEYDKHFLIVSKRAGVAVTLVPKVMITSISVAIETDECPGFRYPENDENRCREFRINPNLLDDLGVDLRDMTRVLFVRDPAERALSAYLNSDDNENISIWGRCNGTRDCTFARWVRELGRNRTASFQNVHFTTQTAIAQFDRMHYHYVLRISSPIDQRFFWRRLLGRRVPSRKNASLGGNTTTTKTPTDDDGMKKKKRDHIYSYFTDEIMEDLVDLYLDDFLLWGRILGGEGTPRSISAVVDGGEEEDEEETAYDVFNVSEMVARRSEDRGATTVPSKK